MKIDPALASGVILTTITDVFGFLSFFLSSSDQTLPLYMWGQLRFPKKLPHVLALGAVIIVVTSLIVILSYWLRNIGNPASKKSNIGGI